MLDIIKGGWKCNKQWLLNFKEDLKTLHLPITQPKVFLILHSHSYAWIFCTPCNSSKDVTSCLNSVHCLILWQKFFKYISIRLKELLFSGRTYLINHNFLIADQWTLYPQISAKMGEHEKTCQTLYRPIIHKVAEHVFCIFYLLHILHFIYFITAR